MRNILFILISALTLSACHSGLRKGAASEGEVKVFRYDRLQYEATVMNSFSALQRMKLGWPQATKLLIEDVLALGDVNDENVSDRLCAYYSDSTLLHLMEDALLKYSDMSDIEEGLTKGFTALKKEVPSIVVPAVYAQISALNQSVVVGDSLLGFSIDKYMGEDYPLYRRYYYDYQRRTMNPDRILPDCFTFYLFSQYPFSWYGGVRSLYDVILHKGKMYWVVKRILGLDSDAEALGYTKAELTWCKKNMKAFWRWMTDHRFLDSTDPMVIRAFTHADPTGFFSRDDIPPMIGVWIGMQLTEKYMKQHPDMTIAKLLSNDDFGAVSLY